ARRQGRVAAVTRPEDAPGRARESAERKRADGAYADGPGGDPALERSIAPERPTLELLEQWSVIEVDESVLYSTRRGGGPITALKRLLMRLMRQYLYELETRQTRFNVALVARFRELEQRVEALERSSGAPAPGDERADDPGAPPA
ncbi:MAG: hypothetical protein WD649_04695, partial [Thermoleophilaceae bacterium]